MTSPEFEILRQSVRLDDTADAFRRAQAIIESGSVNWERLLLMAELHHVRPQLAQLMNYIVPDLVPDGVRETLNRRYQANLHDQISYAAEFLRVMGILKEAGITVIPFKGFWLAHEMYGNLGDREAGDIDLFTDFNDLKRIKSLMLEEGYVVERQMSGYTFDDLWHKCGEYNFDRFEGEICRYHFEFHWRISSPVYGLGIGTGDLASQVTSGTLQGHELSVFTPSASLLLAIMHHGAKDPFMELKQALDIARILDRYDNIDWDWVTSTARRYGAENLVYIAVRLASELSGIIIPAKIADRAAGRKICNITANRIRFMTGVAVYRHPLITLNDWLFRIRSRTGIMLKMTLAFYITGVVLKRFLLPARLR